MSSKELQRPPLLLWESRLDQGREAQKNRIKQRLRKASTAGQSRVGSRPMKTYTKTSFAGLAAILSMLLMVPQAAGCASEEKKTEDPNAGVQEAQNAPATPEEATEFVGRINKDLKDLWTDSARASWVANTYINDDTEKLASDANEAVMGYTAKAIGESVAFKDLKLDPVTARQLHLLRVSSSLPAPADPVKRKELAEIATKMEGMYGKGKYCPPGIEPPNDACQDLNQLSKTLRTDDKTYEELQEAWTGWRSVSVPMRPLYTRYVELGNEGAREIGFSDMSHLWKSRYDMSPEEFETTVEGLWQQVKPLYNDLHCYARRALAKKHEGKFDANGPIPAHLTGNMWAQEWAHLYPMLKPFPNNKASLDVDKALVEKGYDPSRW